MQDEKNHKIEPLELKMLDTSSILLSGEVNKQSAEKVISRLLMLEHVGKKSIKVFIDSPGGDVDAGLAIFDMIRFIHAKVYTIGMGLVASAGALILLAAPKIRRLGLPNSHYLIHQPLAGLRGVASDIEIHAREIEKTRDRINHIIAEETGQSLASVKEDTERDYWMIADEAKQYGLISRIITKHSEVEKKSAAVEKKAPH